jgi:GDSL-like Lipase/Acylhydrolase family
MAGALTLTACVLVLGLIVLRIYEALFHPHVESPDPYLEPFHGPSLLSSWALLVAPFYDSRGQRLAHLAMTAGAAVSFILPSLTRTAGRVPKRAGRGLVLLAALAVVGVAVAGAGWTELAIGAALGAGFAAGARALRRRVVDRTCAVLVGVVLLGATIPGWLKRLNLSAAVPAWVEWHYSTVLGPADLLAAGWRLGAEVPPAYGLLPAVVIAGLERLRGTALEMGDYVRGIQALQVPMLVGCAVLYHRYTRRRWAFTFFGLVLLVPWYHSTQQGLLFPNQTPLRMIGIPLAAAAITAVRRLPSSGAAFPLGLVAGMALLLNVECGIAVTAGVAAFLWQRREPDTGVIPLLVRAGLGALAALVVAVAVCRAVLGTWLRPRDLAAMAETVRLVATSGFSGSPLTVDPLALLMFGHAVVVLCLVARSGGHGPSPAFRAFVAAALVVWFAYYANRPMLWNLAAFHVLYAFLAIDLLRALAASLVRGRVNGAAVLAAAAFAGVLVPAMCRSYSWAQPWRVAGWMEPLPQMETAVVSGVLLEKEWAEELASRAASLRRRSPERRALYFSSDSYLVSKLSGVLPPLPFLDTLNAAITRSRYDGLLSGIAEREVESLFFDPPGSRSDEESPFRGLFQMLRRDLAPDYRRVGVEGGWEVWRRIPPDSVPLRGPGPTGVEPFRILVAGGRTSESAGAAPGRSWTERLAFRLGRQWAGTWVGNAGREGQDTRALGKLLSREAARLDPHLVLFVVGNEDIGVLEPTVTDAPFDLVHRAHQPRLWKGRRAQLVEWCRRTVVPGYRTRLSEIVRAWQRAGADAVLLTQPALFGAGVDPATGVDLATVIVNPDIGLNGRLAWELLEAVNDATRAVGAESGVPVVDLAAHLEKDSRLFDGFLTLSEAGAEEVALRVGEALLPRMKDRRGRT